MLAFAFEQKQVFGLCSKVLVEALKARRMVEKENGKVLKEKADEDSSPSGVKGALVCGRKARIAETSNVKLRASHLVGKTGTIVEVPQHPNTWYQVEVEGEEKPIKFQATALVPLDENGNELTPEPPSADKEDGKDEADSFITFEKSQYESLPSLADKDPNLWVGRDVIIKSGTMSGHLASVIRTGNGWIQLNVTARKGKWKDYMVAKRAYELVAPVGEEIEQLIKQLTAGRKKGEKLSAVKSVSDKRANDKSSPPRSRQIHVGYTVLIKQGQYEGKVGVVTSGGNGYFAIEVDGDDVVRKRNSHLEVINNCFGQKVVKKAVVVLDSEDTGKVLKFDRSKGIYEVVLDSNPKKVLKLPLTKFRVLKDDSESGSKEDSSDDLSSTSARGRSSLANDSNNDSDTNSVRYEKPSSASIRARSNRRQQRAQRRAKSKYSKNSKLNQQNLTKLQVSQRERREVILQYVNRALEKVYQYTPHRPNLQHYLDLIESDSTDPDADEDAYSPLVVSIPSCKVCNLEKLEDSERCWNPACWESPAYKPGAAPVRRDALPYAIKGARKPYCFAVAQSPRRPGFIDVPEYSFPRAETDNGVSRYTAGLKKLENEVVFSPLVEYQLKASKKVLGQRKRPRKPPRDQGLDGYFGRGWMYGRDSVIEDSSEPPESTSLAGMWLNDAENDRLSLQEAAKLSLDFRWRSWKDEDTTEVKNTPKKMKPHPTLEGAADLMSFANTSIPDSESKELEAETVRIKGLQAQETPKPKPPTPAALPLQAEKPETAVAKAKTEAPAVPKPASLPEPSVKQPERKKAKVEKVVAVKPAAAEAPVVVDAAKAPASQPPVKNNIAKVNATANGVKKGRETKVETSKSNETEKVESARALAQGSQSFMNNPGLLASNQWLQGIPASQHFMVSA